MRYAFEQYDQHGFLKAPLLVWLSWLFLAKAWVVFVVAGASRDSGAKILEIVYPDHAMLYLGLVVGVPSIIYMWLINLRSPDRKWINSISSQGRWVTLCVVLLQVVPNGLSCLFEITGFLAGRMVLHYCYFFGLRSIYIKVEP